MNVVAAVVLTAVMTASNYKTHLWIILHLAQHEELKSLGPQN